MIHILDFTAGVIIMLASIAWQQTHGWKWGLGFYVACGGVYLALRFSQLLTI